MFTEWDGHEIISIERANSDNAFAHQLGGNRQGGVAQMGTIKVKWRGPIATVPNMAKATSIRAGIS